MDINHDITSHQIPIKQPLNMPIYPGSPNVQLAQGCSGTTHMGQ
jgi:hypothetical protein